MNERLDSVLLELLDWTARYRVIIVDGARGSGKDWLIAEMKKLHPFSYYKTWVDQGDLEYYSNLGYDITQGFSYAMDLLRQVPQVHPIICNRGFVTCLVFQPEIAERRLKHYESLCSDATACMILVEAPAELIQLRRMSRDGQAAHTQDKHPISIDGIQSEIDTYSRRFRYTSVPTATFHNDSNNPRFEPT